MWGSQGRTDALNGLTRQEWNAAYFLGLEQMFRWDGPNTFAAQMQEGYLRLLEAGHRAQRCDVATAAVPRCSSLPGEHEQSCREILEGFFDPIQRAREALAWIEGTLPHVDTDWLRALLSVYDDAHEAGALPSQVAWCARGSFRGAQEGKSLPL